MNPYKTENFEAETFEDLNKSERSSKSWEDNKSLDESGKEKSKEKVTKSDWDDWELSDNTSASEVD